MPIALTTLVEHEPAGLLATLLAEHDEFWDGRDTRHVLQPVWLRQFAGFGLLAHDRDTIAGYLLGTVTADGVGYVHVIAVRQGYRQAGLGRALWAAFTERAIAAGATDLQAITSVGNTASIAFHTRLGMIATEIPDYAGPGRPRVLFLRRLSRRAAQPATG